MRYYNIKLVSNNNNELEGGCHVIAAIMNWAKSAFKFVYHTHGKQAAVGIN